MDYRKAYEAAKQELTDLLAQQEQVGKRIVIVRQSIQTLAALCESEGVEVKPSAEAEGLLALSTLADDIRAVLSAHVLVWFRPNGVKSELERLGRDLSKYDNPQATIHMVLKRMAESKEIEEGTDPEGKAVYMKRSTLDAYTTAGRAFLRLLRKPDLPPEVMDEARKQAFEGPPPRRESWRGKRAGDVTGPTSAQDSGMLGSVKPKK
jgi:hypothetical protein